MLPSPSALGEEVQLELRSKWENQDVNSHLLERKKKKKSV